MITTAMGHTFRTDTFLQVIFDFGFICVGIVIAMMWVGNDLPVDWSFVAAYAATLSLIMLAINAWLGFYQRIHDRTVEDSRARAVLSLHLSIPVAYVIFLILPEVNADRTLLEISGMAALFGMLSYRVTASHRRSRAIVTLRLLIFGAGKEAATVAASLSKEDQTVRIVGFYPGHQSEELAVPQDLLVPRD